MAIITIRRIFFIPIIQGTCVATAFISATLIALAREHVSKYLPFISEGGAYLPEKGIFASFLSLASFTSVITVTMCYLLDTTCNSTNDKKIQRVNKVAAIFGYLSILGMILICSYEVIISFFVHMFGAGTLVGFTLVYGTLRTWTCYKFCPAYYSRVLVYTKMTLAAIALISGGSTLISAPEGLMRFGDVYSQEHWSGRKTPEDEGFYFIFVGAFFEWLVAICYVFYFYTCAIELKNVNVTIQVSRSSAAKKASSTAFLVQVS